MTRPRCADAAGLYGNLGFACPIGTKLSVVLRPERFLRKRNDAKRKAPPKFRRAAKSKEEQEHPQKHRKCAKY